MGGRLVDFVGGWGAAAPRRERAAGAPLSEAWQSEQLIRAVARGGGRYAVRVLPQRSSWRVLQARKWLETFVALPPHLHPRRGGPGPPG